MGKIPQYNRQQLQSAYVGAPQVDQSGEVMVEGISKGASSIMAVEAKKIEERNKVIIDQQADRALLSHNVMYQQQIKKLEKEYADNPKGFSNAVLETGSALAATNAGMIKDERIAARFLGAANTLTRQAATSAVDWAYAKEEENAQIALNSSAVIQSFSLLDATSHEVLANNANAAIATFEKLPDVTKAQRIKTMSEYYDTYTRIRAVNDPEGFEKELQRYKDDPELLKQLPHLPSDFLEKAFSRTQSQKAALEKIFRAQQRENRATLDWEIYNEVRPLSEQFTRIEDIRESLPEGKGLTTQDHTYVMKALTSRINAGVAKMEDEDGKYQATRYLEVLEEVAKDATDKAKSQAEILKLWEGGFDSQETAYLDKLYGVKGLPTWKDKLSTFLGSIGGVKNTRTKAAAAQEYVRRVASDEDPDLVATEVAQKALTFQAQSDNPVIINFPQAGQIMVSPDGTVAKVYADGKIEVQRKK